MRIHSAEAMLGHKRLLASLITLATALLATSPLAAQERVAAPAGTAPQVLTVEVAPGETLKVQRLENGEVVELDGKLDEALWARLPMWDEFIVIEPDTQAAPTHQTLIRMAYDDAGLYVGADMRQPPETLLTRLSGRDNREINRDSINLTLDTSGEGRYGFWFGVNLGDALMDGTVLPERKFSTDWDGPWVGRSQENETGWTAEMFIPWSAVSMPASGDIRRMGLYLSRKVAYREERWGWPALPDTVPKFMSVLQGLEFERLAPRQQYNIYPFAAMTSDRIDDDEKLRVGLDMFWRPSSSFQLTATALPDFGNVESDDVVINLTATETFFPEKRLFFLEGQEIFVASPRADTRGNAVGQGGSPYTMVNTRRIGGKPRAPRLPAGLSLDKRELNQPTDLYGAAQVAGQIGHFRYGVLGAFEDDVSFDARMAVPGGAARDVHLQQDGRDFAIARLLYEDTIDGAYLGLGVLSTATMQPDRDAHVTGVDYHYLTADGKWKLDGQLMSSNITDIGRGYGGFADFEYTYRRGMSQRLGIEYFDRRFDMNDLGFIERRDHMRVRSSFQLVSTNLGWARDNALDIRGFVQRNVSERLFNSGGLFLSDRLQFNDFSKLVTRVSFFPETYDDLNSFGNGTFRIEEHSLVQMRWDSDTTQPIAYGLGGGWRQENLGGSSWTVEAAINWRPSDRINFALEATWQNRDGWLLHQGRDLFATFRAKQWQPKLSLDYFITARQQLRLSLQWVGIKAREDDFYRIPARPGDLLPVAKPTGTGARPSYDFAISQYSFQVRYRWEVAPLSDVFLVYSRQADLATLLRDEDFEQVFNDAWDAPLADTLVLKARYRFGS